MVYPPAMSWAERAADRSPVVQRTRSRGMAQARSIVDAAQRLLTTKGTFTTQELVKEAGVALQTFYKYFSGKDQLLLAVLEQTISDATERYRASAADLADPLERLRYFVTVTFEDQIGGGAAGFITSEHWRLQPLFPVELGLATKSYTDLIAEAIQDAVAAGALEVSDADSQAWLITQLVMSVWHHYAFAPVSERQADVAERVWQFCLTGLRPAAQAAPATAGKRGSPRAATRPRR